MIPGKEDTAGWPSSVFAIQHGKDMFFFFQEAKERAPDPDPQGEVSSKERPLKQVLGR